MLDVIIIPYCKQNSHNDRKHYLGLLYLPICRDIIIPFSRIYLKRELILEANLAFSNKFFELWKWSSWCFVFTIILIETVLLECTY